MSTTRKDVKSPLFAVPYGVMSPGHKPESSFDDGECPYCRGSVNPTKGACAGCKEEWCTAHLVVLSEGGYCAECERLGDLWVAEMDQAMKEQQYSLWVLCQKTHLFKVPVYNFNDAKTLYHSLNWDVVSGVRIARYCEQEGCEVVLHRFM